MAPGVSKGLKRYIKLPMVTQLCLAGAQCGISLSLMKWFTELLAQGNLGATEKSLLVVTITIAAVSALL